MSLDVTLVDACRRAGRGGSPTAVLDDLPLSDAERCAIPAAAGTSHVVFLSPAHDGSTGLRFFTATGELPACGHGTVAALAVLAQRAGRRHVTAVLRAGGRTFAGSAADHDDGWRAEFDPGPVKLRTATDAETAPVLAALGLGAAECVVGSVGRERMLVEIPDRSTLATITPD